MFKAGKTLYHTKLSNTHYFLSFKGIFEYIDNKMKSEFYASKSCIGFVNKFIENFTNSILDKIDKNLTQQNNIQKTKDYISIIKSEINNQQKETKKLVILEEIYGKTHYDNMSVNQSLYYIDVYSIIENYLTNHSLMNLLQKNYESLDSNIMISFFDGNYYKSVKRGECENIQTIYMSIYADEINLANAIGNCTFYV